MKNNKKAQRAVLMTAAVLSLSGLAHAIVEDIDLTEVGSSGTDTDGAIWSQQTLHPTGTGVYNPFLRLQNKGEEEGFNTDAPKVLDNKGGIWTHSLQLGDLQAIEVDGQTYFSFDLDINEPQGATKDLLSLDSFQLYAVDGEPAISSLAALQAMGDGIDLLYDMDNIGDRSIFLTSSIAPGSGHDDMNVLVPTSYFAGHSADEYLYLYSAFGETGGVGGDTFYNSEGGFEEWRTQLKDQQGPPEPPPPGAPEPMSLMLIGGAFGAVLFARRRRASAPPSA